MRYACARKVDIDSGYVDYDKGQLGMLMCLSVRLEQLFNRWPRIE